MHDGWSTLAEDEQAGTAAATVPPDGALTDAQIAEIRRLAERADALVEASLSANTRKAYGKLLADEWGDHKIRTMHRFLGQRGSQCRLMRDGTTTPGRKGETLTYMMEDPRNITPCPHLLFIAKNIERIGDHATNIAEVAGGVGGSAFFSPHFRRPLAGWQRLSYQRPCPPPPCPSWPTPKPP